MKQLKTLVFSLILVLPLVGVLAACGGTPSTTTTNAPSPTSSISLTPGISPTSPASSTPPAQSTVSVPATTTASSAVVSVGRIATGGDTKTVLTTINGFTLYIHEYQGASGFSCDGSCASTWKPLVYNGTGTPTSTTPLPAKLSIGTDAQGRRVVLYQGYPLFTYVGDTRPGDFSAPTTANSPWQPAYPDTPPGL